VIRATIHTENLFPEVTARVEELALECVTIGAEAGKDAAIAAGARNNATDIEVVGPHTTGDGYIAGVSGPFYYRFLSYGTLGKAIRPKRPGHKRSHAAGTGITPNKMWQAGRLAGRRAMQERATRGL
jgi:hypothetical protein